MIYRAWSEDRGERPMTQIAFDRKMRERGLKVEGSGAKATIYGLQMAPRPVPMSSTPDWSLITRTAKNI
jgi:hypothetical protein